MRKFKCAPFHDYEVDLDDPTTYDFLPNTVKELDDKMFREIGMAICYMDYWHLDVFPKEKQEPDMTRGWTDEEIKKGWPDMFANSGHYQRLRVYKLIEDFTKNRRDKWDDIMWFKEQVFLFQDEIENMC